MGMASFNRLRAAQKANVEPVVDTVATVDTNPTVDAEPTDSAETDYEALAEEFGISVSKAFRLSLADLRGKCDEHGIGYTAGDTRATLFSKISCHCKGC